MQKVLIRGDRAHHMQCDLDDQVFGVDRKNPHIPENNVDLETLHTLKVQGLCVCVCVCVCVPKKRRRSLTETISFPHRNDVGSSKKQHCFFKEMTSFPQRDNIVPSKK